MLESPITLDDMRFGLIFNGLEICQRKLQRNFMISLI